MKIAVAGASGVLGQSLVPKLIKQGHGVRALVRSSARVRSLAKEHIEMMECDLLAPGIDDRLPFLLDGCDAVAHVATAIPHDPSAPNAWETNTRLRTQGVKSLLNAALKAGIKHYIQQSIIMAYPDCGDAWITEDTLLDTSPDHAKICQPVIEMEQMVGTVPISQLNWCILRGGVFVGPDTLQYNTIENLRAGAEIVPGDGSNFVSLIHIADMASAISGALLHAPAGSTFNIVAEPLRQGEYLDQLADVIGVPRPQRDPSLPCPPSWRCSNGAAKVALRWEPTHSIFEQ